MNICESVNGGFMLISAINVTLPTQTSMNTESNSTVTITRRRLFNRGQTWDKKIV